MDPFKAKSFWRDRASKAWAFICPHCTTPRKIAYQPRPTTMHYVQIGLTAAFFTLMTWHWFSWKGMVSFIPFWTAFEALYRGRVRAAMHCPHCGFDPYLYLVDIKRARAEIEVHWRKKFADHGVSSALEATFGGGIACLKCESPHFLSLTSPRRDANRLLMSVNKVILVGRLGQNPEVRYTPSGAAVANFSVATNESWTDKSGQKQERTEWHKVVVWGKLAELCAQYLAKGRQCYLEGRLQTRQWQDKDNQTKYTTEVQAQTVQFLGATAGAGAGASRDGGGEFQQDPSYEASQGQGQGGGYGAPRGGRGAPAAGGGGGAGMAPGNAPEEPSFTEDDIPF